MSIWNDFKCTRCGCKFIVLIDREHKQENTYCPECKLCILKKR